MKLKKNHIFLIVAFSLTLAVYADGNKTKSCVIYNNNIFCELTQSEIAHLEDLLAKSKKIGLAKVFCPYRIKIVNGDDETVYKTNGTLVANVGDIYYELEEDIEKLYLGGN